MTTSAQLYPFLWDDYQEHADIRRFLELGYTIEQCQRLSKQWRENPPTEPTFLVAAWWEMLKRVERGEADKIDRDELKAAQQELGPKPERRPPPPRKTLTLKQLLRQNSKNNLSPKQYRALRNKARLRYQSGMETFNQLLASLNVSKRTLIDWLTGVNPPAVSQTLAHRVQEAYRNGTSITSICREFNLSLDETHRHLHGAHASR